MTASFGARLSSCGRAKETPRVPLVASAPKQNTRTRKPFALLALGMRLARRAIWRATTFSTRWWCILRLANARTTVTRVCTELMTLSSHWDSGRARAQDSAVVQKAHDDPSARTRWCLDRQIPPFGSLKREHTSKAPRKLRCDVMAALSARRPHFQTSDGRFSCMSWMPWHHRGFHITAAAMAD